MRQQALQPRAEPFDLLLLAIEPGCAASLCRPPPHFGSQVLAPTVQRAADAMQEMLAQLAVAGRNTQVMGGGGLRQARTALMVAECLSEFLVRDATADGEDTTLAIHVKPSMKHTRQGNMPRIVVGWTKHKIALRSRSHSGCHERKALCGAEKRNTQRNKGTCAAVAGAPRSRGADRTTAKPRSLSARVAASPNRIGLTRFAAAGGTIG